MFKNYLLRNNFINKTLNPGELFRGGGVKKFIQKAYLLETGIIWEGCLIERMIMVFNMSIILYLYFDQ